MLRTVLASLKATRLPLPILRSDRPLELAPFQAIPFYQQSAATAR